MPSQPEQTITAQTVQGTDAGTDSPTRTLEQTQAPAYNDQGYAVGQLLSDESGEISNLRRNPETGELYDATGLDRPQSPSIAPGAASRDDSGLGAVGQSNNTNSTSRVLQADGLVTPQDNVLDRFSSYTYNVSVYMMSPEQMTLFTNSQQKRYINNYNLLFQSGGASSNVKGPQGSVAGQINALNPASTLVDGRNPFFTDDFYIDSITLTNKLFGKSTGASHSATEIKFTVIEPANITLIDRLYQAAQDLAPKTASGKINYASAYYLMVIRFYGYDANGNLVKVGAANEQQGLTDSRAVVEKYIPFLVKEIKFSVSGKLVTYEWDCATVGNMVAASTRRGTIPADVELSGATVGSMLGGTLGNAAASTNTVPGNANTPFNAQDPEVRRAQSLTNAKTSAPPKATATPAKSVIRTGLIEAMNAQQAVLVSQKVYEFPDEYRIVFAPGAESIRDATVSKPGNRVAKENTAPAPSASQSTQTVSPDKQNVSTTTRVFGVAAGMQLVQAIDLIIRNSNYITDQANIIYDETTGQPKPNPKAVGNTKGFRWFNILFTAEQLQYDWKRNDYAYRMTYTIVPYVPQDFMSPYFPPPKFRGVHKRYPYWFTGQNTAVLDYTASFNKLYTVTLSNTLEGGSQLAELRKKFTSAMRDSPFFQYQARSNESSQGADTRANEPAANAAEYMYNPSDNANAKLRIIGDPAWIQQSSMSGVRDSVSFSPFGPDGTINFDVNDVLLEVVWQKPEDYNLESGLAEPYSRTSRIFGNRQPVQSAVYRAHTVSSEFRQGKFEQVIDCTLYLYPVEPGTNRAPGPPPGSGQSPELNEESDNQRSQESTDASRTSASAPSAVPLEQSVTNANDPLGTVDVSAAAAQQNNYPGPLIVNPLPIPNLGTEPGQFFTQTPSPADQSSNASPAQSPFSNGVSVGPATGGSPIDIPVSGQVLSGVVVGPVILNGLVIQPDDPRYADAANRLLESVQRQNALFATRQQQIISKDF
jgi:hypothetical protein